jgi:hypothetical protein
VRRESRETIKEEVEREVVGREEVEREEVKREEVEKGQYSRWSRHHGFVFGVNNKTTRLRVAV